MPVTVLNTEDLTRVLRPLGIDVPDLLMRIPGQLLILDRKRRVVAELGRETFGPHAGAVHEDANVRALQGEDVTYQWDLQKGRQQLRLSTTVSPLRNPASRIVGLLVVTRNIRALADVAHQLSAREQDVLHLWREGYRPRSIGEILHVSPQTVRNHLKAIFKKTSTHSQEELITMSRRPADGG